MYGAEIVYSPGDKGSNGAVEMALDMAASDSRFYMPYQYGNPANPAAHYHGTGPDSSGYCLLEAEYTLTQSRRRAHPS